MSGRIVHFEIPFDDGDRAHSFYEQAFGWSLNRIPDMGYTMVSTGPVSEEGIPTEPGFINGGMLSLEYAPSSGPIVVIDVTDLDAALAKVVELGAETVVERTEVGEMGWSAYFRDPEGNVMGLWQSANPG
jgi:hypothetical protein